MFFFICLKCFLILNTPSKVLVTFHAVHPVRQYLSMSHALYLEEEEEKEEEEEGVELQKLEKHFWSSNCCLGNPLKV